MTNKSKAKGSLQVCPPGKGHLFLAEKLLTRLVRRPNGCWEYSGATSGAGYGDIWISRGAGHILAHRLAWMLHNQEDEPMGFDVRHSCDNPPCCNPHHLLVGTHKQNSQDSVSRGRATGAKGEANWNCKLTDAQVREIRGRHRVVHPKRATGCSTKELSIEFGISRAYVTQLVKGDWRVAA